MGDPRHQTTRELTSCFWTINRAKGEHVRAIIKSSLRGPSIVEAYLATPCRYAYHPLTGLELLGFLGIAWNCLCRCEETKQALAKILEGLDVNMLACVDIRRGFGPTWSIIHNFSFVGIRFHQTTCVNDNLVHAIY